MRQVVHGAWASSEVADTLDLRVAALRLVVPEAAVVTDRTAAWLHGVPILPRSAVFEVPPVCVFLPPGLRLRRAEVASGERGLLPRDIMTVDGLRVTTPLRTACDLGRLLWRFDAIAALDGFLRIGLPHEELLREVLRFRGYRGVVQLRNLVPIADGRSESVGESGLRLHWHESGLPDPELQWWVEDDDGVERYRLDLALPEVKFAAEYDGEQFHSSDEQRAADLVRRTWLSEHRDWEIMVFTKHHVYDRTADPVALLREGYRATRVKRGLRVW